MKHKAQESKEIICSYADGNPSSSGQFVGMMLQKADDTLQDLINCQLTYSELQNCIIALDCFSNNLHEKTYERIRAKLFKQYGMWVSDDETN